MEVNTTWRTVTYPIDIINAAHKNSAMHKHFRTFNIKILSSLLNYNFLFLIIDRSFLSNLFLSIKKKPVLSPMHCQVNLKYFYHSLSAIGTHKTWKILLIIRSDRCKPRNRVTTLVNWEKVK